jgi:hypothetical protein
VRAVVTGLAVLTFVLNTIEPPDTWDQTLFDLIATLLLNVWVAVELLVIPTVSDSQEVEFVGSTKV